MRVLRRAGEVDILGWETALVEIIRLADPELRETHWIWGASARDGMDVLRRLHAAFREDEVERLVKSVARLYLSGGGAVDLQLPKDRPEGEVCVAIWFSPKPVPEEYATRLLRMGQCEEFWCLPGTMGPYPDLDWRRLSR